MSETTADHWNGIWSTKPPEETSWYETTPADLAPIRAIAGPSASVIDVGGGTSSLAGCLLDDGWTDVTVLDISERALDVARSRLGERAASVHWIVADVTAWTPPRVWAIWHDRAVLHFLLSDDDVERYVATAAQAVVPGGHAVIATFAPDGPTSCSGLPVRRWSADELGARLAPAFEAIESATHVHTTPWGAAQPFTVLTARRASDPADRPGSSSRSTDVAGDVGPHGST